MPTPAYREELFSTLTFRGAYDRLLGALLDRADRGYLRLLYVAASASEGDLETILSLVLDAGSNTTFDAVCDLVRDPVPPATPVLTQAALGFGPSDRLFAAAGQ